MIIPVYNDSEGLRDTLKSMENQDLHQDEYEVIVVDNDSTDSTPEVICKFSKSNKNFRGLEEKKIQSSYASRNTGIKASKGDIICFLDSDMWAYPGYLSKVRNYFEDKPDLDYIGCRVEMVNDSDTLTGKFNEMKAFPVKRYIDEKRFAPTCCLSVRRNIFSEIGLFNQELISGGDKLFGKKAARKGLEMRYVDDIKVFHPVRDKPLQIASKYFRMGRGWYQKKELENEELEDKEVELTDIFSVLKKLIAIAKDDLEYEELRPVEVLGFAGLNCVKKASMFSGYQYQRMIYLRES